MSLDLRGNLLEDHVVADLAEGGDGRQRDPSDALAQVRVLPVHDLEPLDGDELGPLGPGV